jgi:ElaB/YqjD/DUF883 family membrane-anchored ribosome-binding protein
MSKKNHHRTKEEHTVAECTTALLDATSHVADAKVAEVRNRLSAAMAAAKDTYQTLQRKTVQTAKAADQAVRGNPYKAVGIAFGVGALVGLLLSRRSRNTNSNSDSEES